MAKRKMQFSKNQTDWIVLILLVLLMLLFQLITVRIARYGGGISVGGKELEYGRLCSIFNVLQTLTCMLMVINNKFKGWVCASLLTIISLITVSRTIFIDHQIENLPGATMQILNLAISMLLYSFVRKCDNNAAKLEEIANTDELTGLPNRRSLLRHVTERISKGKPFAFVLLDLDNFKSVNDTAGHEYGDEILQQIALRWTKQVKNKNAFFARLGGDEFVMITDYDESPEQLEQMLHQAINRTPSEQSSKFLIHGNSFFITASMGIALFPQHADNFSTLMSYADIAMYQAKASGKQNLCMFQKEMDSAISDNMQMEQMIRDALQEDRFYLQFQPQYHISTHRLRGFETLVRMRDEQGNTISPGRFIPVAESSTLMIQLDQWIMRSALISMLPIVQANPDVILSVNVSVRNLLHGDFSTYVQDLLKETGFPAKNLELEVTESLFISSLEHASAILNRLRNMGIRIALDDFGTGYASLSYLNRLPIDLLKIDKSFIDQISDSENGSAFVKAIITMGHVLGCDVISEGVESDNQLDVLQSYSCDLLQGFLWSKPLSLEQAQLLTRQEPETLSAS
ncbi:putative bifunctional diguanylate cyclase/phosphodiesterase [Ruminococcus sp.]|uniref:putative bifunctional diguanylate cyclase/phosphodiesterase n=1 Tax=Ruminococcus sp. TaxID=41978 RepID=UPI003F0BBE12